MICVKFTAFCDLRMRLAAIRKSILNLAEGIKPVNPAEAVEHDVISIFNDFLSTHGPLRTQGFLGTVGKINALVFEVVPQQLRTSYF